MSDLHQRPLAAGRRGGLVMDRGRRSVLAALGLAVPFGLWARRDAAGATPPTSMGEGPELRLRPFEQALREAFAGPGLAAAAGSFPCRRVEVGHADLLDQGVQGRHNDRPFAGFPAGHLRIIRTGAEPGPAVGGVRLYVSWVEVALMSGHALDRPSRPLDFAMLPPAATLGDPNAASIA